MSNFSQQAGSARRQQQQVLAGNSGTNVVCKLIVPAEEAVGTAAYAAARAKKHKCHGIGEGMREGM